MFDVNNIMLLICLSNRKHHIIKQQASSRMGGEVSNDWFILFSQVKVEFTSGAIIVFE